LNRCLSLSTTGASLVTAALADASFRSRIAATVFPSPNYGINRPGAGLLTLPFASLLTRLLLSRTYSFLPANAGHAAHWTTSYPSSALLPMVAALVKLAVNIPAEDIEPLPFSFNRLTIKLYARTKFAAWRAAGAVGMTSSTSAKRANKQPRFSERYSFAADDHGPHEPHCRLAQGGA
jgi:hypothetical protein